VQIDCSIGLFGPNL